jgi:outer membrane protein assembly factor BamB
MSPSPKALALILLITAILLASVAVASDWPELRGPSRDGLSPETGLPEKWSPTGENLVWRAPYGGISGPVVLGDRIFLHDTVGEGRTLQERIVSLDANTGSLVWEKRIDIHHSDVAPNRAGWATPAVDPETGYVYILSSGGELSAFTRAGLPLWIRDLTEEFGFVAAENGRIASPTVDGSLAIVDGVTFDWGEHAAGAHRFLAFDKRTGDAVWVSAPEKRLLESTWSPPLITDVGGVRMLAAGGGDGAFHAINVATGEPVWRFEVSKRGINTGVVRSGANLILSHGEANVETSTTGFLAAISADVNGEVAGNQAKWLQYGFTGAVSPVADGQRIYRIDNQGVLAAFDANTGRQVWSLKTGPMQNAAPVLADGKIYVGTEDGRFFILRPRADGCDILSQVQLGSAANPEPITASAAVSNGRVYFTSSKAVYALGSGDNRIPSWSLKVAPFKAGAENRAPASLQLIPADEALYPGQTARFLVRVLDAAGNLIREEPQSAASQAGGQRGGRGAANAQPPKSELEWSLEGIAGAVQPDGFYTVPSDAKGSAGRIRVKLGALSGDARVRIIPTQWETSFDEFQAGSTPAWWVNAPFAVRDVAGNRVLAKAADPQASILRHVRAYSGLHNSSNYTLQSDVRFAGRLTGEAGVIGQGYELVLVGARQQIELRSWAAETSRTKTSPLALTPDTWQRVKLRVESLLDGSVQVRGKVWPITDPEPTAWTVERTDSSGFGHLIGSPGLYADAASEVYFDNLKVIPNP